jgi:Domain of unknown function (DUF5615)
VSRPRFLGDEDLRFETPSPCAVSNPLLISQRFVEIGRSRSSDAEVLEFANGSGLLVISHDVNTLRAEAEQRIVDGRGIAGVFLASQRQPTRAIAESIVLIWAASEAEEWANRVVFLPI